MVDIHEFEYFRDVRNNSKGLGNGEKLMWWQFVVITTGYNIAKLFSIPDIYVHLSGTIN